MPSPYRLACGAPRPTLLRALQPVGAVGFADRIEGRELEVAEATILVCDVCGRSAAETVMIRVAGRNLQKDLCNTHLAELTKGARAPRRGRRRGQPVAARPASASPKRRGRPRKAVAKSR